MKVDELLEAKEDEPSIPKTIGGRKLSDYTVLTAVNRGEYTVYVSAPSSNPRGRSSKKNLKTFDNETDAANFKKLLVAAGAKKG